VIATPEDKSSPAWRDVAALGLLLALWLVPGAVLWVAAFVCGARPTPDLWAWPYRAGLAYLAHRPFEPWTWVGAGAVASPALFYSVCVVALLLAAIAAVGGYSVVQGGIIAWFPHFFRRAGPPRWATQTQRQALTVRGPRTGRMILGHHGTSLIATEPGASLLVLGPAGSGKSASFTIPIVQEWKGPVLAASLTPDLVDATAGIRQHRSRVSICDPGGVTGRATGGWSPIQGCEDFAVSIRRADWMLQGTLPDVAVDVRGDGSYAASHALLSTSLWAAARTATRLEELGHWLEDPDLLDLRAAVLRIPSRDPRADHFLVTLAQRDRAERAAYSDRVAALVQACLGDPAPVPFDPYGLALGGETLYVVGPTDDPSRSAPYLAGIVGEVLDAVFTVAATRALEKPLLVVLDGTAAVAPIRELDRYLAVAGSLNVAMLVTFRDLQEIRARYGVLAEDVAAGAQAAVFMGGQEDEGTLRLASDLTRLHLSGGSISDPAPVVRQPDRSALDLAGLLGPGQAVLLYEGLPPIPLWTRHWYRTEHLVKLAARRPYVRGVSRIRVDPDDADPGGPVTQVL